MQRCITGLFLATLLLAQPPTEATLSGKITDAATHQPIEGAQISSRGGRGAKPAVANSDATGAYTIRLPASQRTGIAISKPGYSTLDIASSDRTSVRLNPGDTETRDFELSKPGSLSGHLVDRDSGKPLPGFYIHAIRWYAGLENSTGFRYPAPPTSSDGSFSIANLPPSSYVLVVDPSMAGKIVVPEIPPAKKKDESGYGPTWYPGVPQPEMATPIALGYGENRQLEIRLRKHDLLHIAGTFQVPEGLVPQGAETGSISITLNTEEKGRPTGAEGEIPHAGPFRIDGLEPGSYRILAATRSPDGQHRLFASQLVVLTGHSVDDLSTELRPGVTLRVALKMAEENTEPPRRFNFIPLSTDGWGPLDESPPGTDSGMNRTNLPPGKYNLALMQMPGYAVASMTLNGTPLPPGAAVDLQSPESLLTYVLTTQLGSIAGTVRDSDGQPVPEATVVLAPEAFVDTAGDPLSLPPGAGETVMSDGNGRFVIEGLAPGHYKATAFKDGGRMNGAIIRERLRTAEPVTVTASQTTSLDLKPR